ncbi:MAG TPA: FimB/Mfa2 family fimbrial subunit [Candidatus Coprenecus pullistercoris]|nr:FimB/Mfa2 family fimbrial subunit [Candidatus Coprenecus pullistercoris]
MARTRQIWILAILFLCGATACIRENIDDCETPVTLDFLYFGDEPVDIFSQRIKTVDLFIYGQNGDLVQTVTCSEADLASRQGVDLRLLEGEYRIVCWGNAGENTHIEAEGSTPRIGETSWFEGTECSGIDPLYFGEKTITVPRTLRPVRDTVIYNSSHITIAVNMIGFANADNFDQMSTSTAVPASSDAIVTLSHEDLSAWIDFTHVPSEELTDYVPELSVSSETEDTYTTLYRVPKFPNSTVSELAIRRNDTGEQLYRRSFADILETLGIDVTERDELTIKLDIRISNMNGIVQIDVIGWSSEIVYPIV